MRILEMAVDQIEEMNDVVEKIGPIFYFNTSNGVIAVCLKNDLMEAHKEYMEKVEDGSIPASERITLLVTPTFTFSQTASTWRPIHIAVMGPNMQFLIEQVLSKALKCPMMGRLDQARLERYEKILFIRDSRIYVPFAGENYIPLWQLYSRYTWEHTRQFLLADVKAPE